MGRRKNTLVATATEQAKQAGAIAHHTAERATDAAGSLTSALPLEPITEQLKRRQKRAHRKQRRQSSHHVLELADTLLPLATATATAAKKHRKHAKARANKPAKRKGKKRRGFFLLVLGAGATAAVVMYRRRASGSADIAPDPFGAAVEAEREARGSDAQKPIATPGA